MPARVREAQIAARARHVIALVSVGRGSDYRACTSRTIEVKRNTCDARGRVGCARLRGRPSGHFDVASLGVADPVEGEIDCAVVLHIGDLYKCLSDTRRDCSRHCIIEIAFRAARRIESAELSAHFAGRHKHQGKSAKPCRDRRDPGANDKLVSRTRHDGKSGRVDVAERLRRISDDA